VSGAGDIGKAVGFGISTAVGLTVAGMTLKGMSNLADSTRRPEPKKTKVKKGSKRRK
jgi:hypothetical protein